MPIKDKTEEQREARCEFCFEPRRGRKFLKAHVFLDNVEYHGFACDARCRELWQQQMKAHYQKTLRAVGF